jgi:hypothetical protein
MGEDIGQLVFETHSTHVEVVGLQCGAPCGQLVSLRHATQPPIDVSQWGSAGGHIASLLHDGTQVVAAVLQTGVGAMH